MPQIRAAFFDFGGVILSSPFEAFTEYERTNGLPDGFIRGLNSTNPDTNAWAQLERSTVPFDEFCRVQGNSHGCPATFASEPTGGRQIGRASCRERV